MFSIKLSASFFAQIITETGCVNLFFSALLFEKEKFPKNYYIVLKYKGNMVDTWNLQFENHNNSNKSIYNSVNTKMSNKRKP